MGFLADLEIGWFNGWIYSALLLVIACSNFLFAKRMTVFSWMSRKRRQGLHTAKCWISWNALDARKPALE